MAGVESRLTITSKLIKSHRDYYFHSGAPTAARVIAYYIIKIAPRRDKYSDRYVQRYEMKRNEGVQRGWWEPGRGQTSANINGSALCIDSFRFSIRRHQQQLTQRPPRAPRFDVTLTPRRAAPRRATPRHTAPSRQLAAAGTQGSSANYLPALTNE